jgi:hypothetical protein
LHFWLKAEARTVSALRLLAMGDDDVFALSRHMRWGEGKEVVCPHCAAWRTGTTSAL